jgi:hypothetical protein
MAGIVVSNGFAMSVALQSDARLPILGWQSFADFHTISADSEKTIYPATNMANASTSNRWESDSLDEQFITVDFGVEREVDYLGIARHNWASGGVTVSIEGLPFGGDPEEGGDWQEIFEPVILPDDGPRLFRFQPSFFVSMRIRLVPDAVKPTAAVLKLGKLTMIRPGIPPGHKPIKYARSVSKIGGRAQGGDYLGSIVSGASLASSIDLQMLDPTWYRAVLEPFRLACEDENPFFWAWAPQHYPDEVGYCWVTNDPIPSISHQIGLIDISFAIEGIAL